MITSDNGYVIYDSKQDMFYTGMGFNKNIRFAQVYHSSKYVKDAIKNMPHKFPYIKPDKMSEYHEFIVFPVNIRITSSFPIDLE